MFKRLIVAIDGPAGSGKSTSAKLVAQRLGYLYIDSGAMYRAVTLLAIRQSILKDEEAVVKLSKKLDFHLEFFEGVTKVIVDGEDVSDAIRSREVNANVSDISAIAGVRTALVDKQRELSRKNKGVVMEGRDIGTVVFPDADIKIFLTASIEERAKRRTKEYETKGIHVSQDEVKKNLLQRDSIDSSRDVSPLVKAPDACEVDTSKVTIDEQVSIILEKIKEVAEKKGVDLPV